MFVVFVTGSIGSGKSSAVAFMRERGAAALDLDALAKDLLDVEDVRREVVARFGEGVLDAEGRVDRSRLAAAAFASDEAVRRLEAVVHPLVAERTRALLADLASRPDGPAVAVVEAPLLARVPELAADADLVLAIEAPEDVRVARAVERGLPESAARERIARQPADASVRELAHAVIANDSSREEFLGELERFWEREVAPRVG